MSIQKLLNSAWIVRVGRNSHRFICRINGKCRIFSTHEKDFDHHIASLFGSLNRGIPVKAAVSCLLFVGLSSPAFSNNLPTGFSVAGGSINTPVISNGGHNMTVHANSTNSAANWK